MIDTTEFADLIGGRLARDAHALKSQWNTLGRTIRYFVLDGLLENDLARMVSENFPAPRELKLSRSMRELKYVSAQMDKHAPVVESCLFAFQAPAVLDAVRAITGKQDLEPDPALYAGGVSLMTEGCFLNPHIDNSHDHERARWRNLNLLYYVTPDWDDDRGGHLELWPAGPKGHSITIPARFNRLIVMETHHRSWHSVSRIASGARKCVSNYYFGPTPMQGDQQFHVTSFRGRPEQQLRDILLLADGYARMAVRKVFPKGVVDTGHRYLKPGEKA